MKTQISRDSFQPQQHFSGVYLQQGRMILDADWNELTDIQKARLVDALRDAIAGGAPRAGGLRIFAAPPGSTNIRIQPGVLYVEGAPARLEAAVPLEVDKQPDYPIAADYTGQNLTLYADVWERSVTALERSDLLDAALHGADTATRSQTLLQVKWCANTLDPLDPSANPPIGNAPLTLKLRLIASSGDPCNPCADQVKVDERLGNYLFRVEVHDYDAATKMLTLKWSRDNGAEASATDSLPQGFGQGDWVFEYFDTDTERLLGNHFAPNPKKLRGLIKETAETPTGNDEPKTYVRQWDGYIKINLNNGALSGRDRGESLATGLVSNQSHGRVNLTGGVLKINLELMELELATTGKSFVPGDYWQAVVREAVNKSGDTVLADAIPHGVRHHYLYLGELGVDKKLAVQGDAFRRRMNFPPLTDITAADVGFSDHCVGLFAGAKNVQQALDNLCAIGAEDIAYLLPNCGPNEGKSIKDNLKTQLDPDNDGKLTVKDALDKLLCLLNAATLPYDVPACASGPSVRQLLGLVAGNNNAASVLDKLLCEFKANDLPLDKTVSLPPIFDAAVTVQEALKLLAEHAGGGCAVTVGTGGVYPTLASALNALAGQSDLNLCLLPGTQSLVGVTSAKHRSIKITGSGTVASVVEINGGITLLGEEIDLRNLTIRLANDSNSIALQALKVQAVNCAFEHASFQLQGVNPLVLIKPAGGEVDLVWRDNRMDTQTNAQPPIGAVSLSLINQSIGGAIEGCVIKGDLVLMSGEPLPLDANTPLDKPDHPVSYAPGANLHLRGNQLARTFFRINWSASVLGIYAGLVVSGNIFSRPNNSFAACALTLEGNQFIGALGNTDVAAVAIGRSGIFSTNQAFNPNATIKLCLWHVAVAANLLQFRQLGGPLCASGYGYGYGYGCGEPLLNAQPIFMAAPDSVMAMPIMSMAAAYPGAFDYFESVGDEEILPGFFVTSGSSGLKLAGPEDSEIIGVSLDPAELPEPPNQAMGSQQAEVLVGGYRIPYMEERVRTDETDGRRYLENPLGYAENDEFMSVIEGRVYLDEAALTTPPTAPPRLPIGLRGRFKVYLEQGAVVHPDEYVSPADGGRAAPSPEGQGYRVVEADAEQGLVTILFPDEGGVAA